MKKLVLLLAVLIMVLPTAAAAKSVLYVSSQNCPGLGCGCLNASSANIEDRLFCDRLVSIGYNVTTTVDSYANASGTEWLSLSSGADMIFIGNIDKRMVTTNDSQPSFCSSLGNAGKPLFFTGINTYKNITNMVQGCAFNLSYAAIGVDGNTCSGKTLWVNKTGYITKGYSMNDNFDAYTTPLDINVHSGYGWLGVNCQPKGGGSPDKYSAVSISGSGAFWGLNAPSKFTNRTWDLFERTVLYFMNDYEWNVSYIKIPTYHTINDAFIVLATVKDRGKLVSSGTVSYLLDSNRYGLNYNLATGRWENLSAAVLGAGSFKIEAEEGSKSDPFNVGSIRVAITSGNYQPGTYKITAEPKLGSEIINGAVDYKIYDSNYDVKKSGVLTRNGDRYEATVDLTDLGTLLLEVNAKTADNYGGSYKKIYPASALKAGTDYAVTPSEWYVTSKTAGKATQVFTFKSLKANLTNIQISRGGSLADSLSLDLTGVPKGLTAGDSLTFTTTLDYSAKKEGNYGGSVVFSSDQLNIEIPVNLTVANIVGDWLSVSPVKWELTLMEGATESKTFTLDNRGTWTATGFSLGLSPEIEGMVSMSDISYIRPASKADAALTVTGESKGSYSGKITISSVVGVAVIDLSLEVIEDLDKVAAGYASDISGIESDLTALSEKGSDVTSFGKALTAIKDELDAAKADIAAERYADATAKLDSVKAAIADLQADVENAPGPFPWTAVIIVLVVIVAGVGGYYAYIRWKGKKPEEEEEEEPTGENEEYRTEYY